MKSKAGFIGLVGVLAFTLVAGSVALGDTVKIGLNYPKTGPYEVQGLDQWRAAEMAVAEINAAGGILGRPVEIIWRDTQSKPDIATDNATELIDQQGVKMIFGGVSSAVAISTAKVCHSRNVPFFGTLTYSTATTGTEALKTTFRECYDSWMAAKAISDYLKKNYPNKKYFYITADYSWGWTTEASLRSLTATEDEAVHQGVKTPFPSATVDDFNKALTAAQAAKPDVLVLVEFGRDMEVAIRNAATMGLKQNMQIVVPNLTLGMAEGAGPKVMEGVVGTLPWSWQIPYKYNYPRGKEFVEKFSAKYNRYPCTSGASAYTIMYEYKAAVERAGSFETPKVIAALENHEYTFLKDKQVWRDFDHQSVQTVYMVKCRPEAEVLKDKYKLDYFEILGSIPGTQAAVTFAEWKAIRQSAKKLAELE